MEEIPFVKPEEAALARDMEKRLLEVRDDAGISFVGVSVRPTKQGEPPVFYLWVGISRETSEDLIPPLVDVVFQKELQEGVKIQVESHRGVIRS